MKKRLIYAWNRIKCFTDWYKTIPPLKKRFVGLHTVHVRGGPTVWVRGWDDDVRITMQMLCGKAIYPLKQLNLGREALILDLGANIGTFTMATRVYYPDAHFYCYEMDPRNVEVLKLNVPYASVISAAITGHDGTVVFYENNHYTSSTISRPNLNKKVTNPVQHTVPTISFASLLRNWKDEGKEVDLVKMDIELAEYDAIMKTPPELLKTMKNLLLEIHDTATMVKLISYIEAAGFVIMWANELNYWFKRIA